MAMPVQKVTRPARASIPEKARDQKGTLAKTSPPVMTRPITKRITWAIRGVQKTLEWPRLERKR